MGIVSSTGVGSGIDIQSLVTSLATSEGQPAKDTITSQQNKINTRLSGLGTLKSSLSTFETAVNKLKTGSLFKTHTASSSDETILKATASTGSVTGTYAVEVTQLAKAQKSISSSEFASTAAVVGTGTLSFTATSGASFDITVNSGNDTLVGLRDAINSSSNNTFATASIINVDNAAGTGTISKLVLTAKNSGKANAFTVSGSDDDGDSTDASGLSQIFSTNLTEQTAAADAIISVDGQTATRSSNSMTDVLPGTTLDLQSVSAGKTVNVSIGVDNAAITQTITDFVSAYNTLHTTTKSLGVYGGSTDGSGAGNGALIGDATLRYVTSQLRQDATNVVSSVTGNNNSLAMIGVTIDKNGVMALDSSKLNSVLSSDIQAVSDVFSSSDGVANRLYSRLSGYLQSGGPLDSQQTSLKSQLSTLDTRLADVQARVSNIQKSLLKQFTAMDTLVGQFKSTGTFLTSWLAGKTTTA